MFFFIILAPDIVFELLVAIEIRYQNRINVTYTRLLDTVYNYLYPLSPGLSVMGPLQV